MLEHLPCVRINPAHFRPQPIGGTMDERAIRFELERQACQSLRQVLQLKLQQRRSREELVNQGIMPPLKSSAAFHEQRRSLERARTEDYLKRKIKGRPEKSELIRMHILEESPAEPLLQAKQLQLKRARLVDNLNDKIAHRPGPMELIHKNILPVHSSIKQAITETQFPKASGGTSSCDEDSNANLSPGQPVSQECLLALGPEASPAETLAGNSLPSPTQVPPPARPLPLPSGSSTSLKLTNGKTAASVQRTVAHTHVKPKPNSTQKHKKAKDNKPKVKKLKYHQYIPPDQKGDKEPPPHLDSSYAKILQQQQLFLQLQILSQQQQQQQHYNYHTILPAPPKPQSDQSSPSSSSISPTTSSSPPQPAAAPSTSVSNQQDHNFVNTAALAGTKPTSLPSNLDEMKVAELKCELKLRSLPLSGTKNDLIERLRTYQELNGGSDTTFSPTAGGTTGPGAEGAAASSRSAATTNKNPSSRQKTLCHHTSLHIADATPPAATPKQLMICGGTVVLPPVSPLTPSNHSPMSPEDGSFSNEPLGGLMSSPLTQLSVEPSSTAQLQANIKEEPTCSAQAPCQFSLKSSSQKKHCLASSAAHTVASSALAIDKDRMLHEKDKQIEELTRMLMQKQRLVELLKRQLEHGSRDGRVSEPLILVRVKEEPPDEPSVALSSGCPPLQVSSTSHGMDATRVAVKEEALEEAPSDTTVPSGSDTLLQPLGRTELAKPVPLKPEQKNAHVCLKQSALQLAQQQAIQKLLLQRQQQQQSIQKQQQTVQKPSQLLVNQQNLQKLCQQKKKKLQKLQVRQQQEQEKASQSHEQLQHSKHLQQMQLKQQILLKQQKSLLQQHLKQQQQSKKLQQIQIQTKIHMKQQQVQTQQNQGQQHQQQQPAQVSQAYFNQQSAFPLDLLKSDSTPTLVTDSNGNHFLIALTSHINGNQSSEASEEKVANHITLQSHSGGRQVSVDQPQQGAAQRLSALLTQPSFSKDQDAASLGKNSSPSSRTDVGHSFDALFSPLSPASIKTATSSSDDKPDTEHEEDFIDTIMQTGEMSATLNQTQDSSLHRQYPNSSAPSPVPSPLHQSSSPPFPPNRDAPQADRSLQHELLALDFLKEEKQDLSRRGSGRLEDFLESTTGKPLLGVEPGGLLTVIDDLNSQMLCTPSILDHLPSPMDTFDMVAEDQQGLDNMDWLDFTMEKEKEEEMPTLAPLAPQTPPSVFSTDFLDSYDLYIHWDSCL